MRTRDRRSIINNLKKNRMLPFSNREISFNSIINDGLKHIDYFLSKNIDTNLKMSIDFTTDGINIKIYDYVFSLCLIDNKITFNGINHYISYTWAISIYGKLYNTYITNSGLADLNISLIR